LAQRAYSDPFSIVRDFPGQKKKKSARPKAEAKARSEPPVSPLPESPPLTKDTPAVLEPPPPESSPLPESSALPPNAPHLRLPYAALDLLRKLKPGPRAVCEEIYRASAGWHSDECVISLGKLAQYCRLDEKNVRTHLRTLEAEGYIKRLQDVVGGREVAARGIRFRILLPRMTPPQKVTPDEKAGGAKSSPIKERSKDIISKVALPRDFSKCPDCLGTGVQRMPDGTYKPGCPHPKLREGG
jgi:hypothetical protein